MTTILLASEASLAPTKGLDGSAVEVVVQTTGGVRLSALVARRIAARVAALTESLLRDGVTFSTYEGTEDGLGLRLVADSESATDLPDGKALPKGVTRDGDLFAFAAAVADDPFVVPGPDEFPDVLPGSHGPLASAVQLFVGLPMTGYLSVEEGHAVAEVNEALGLDYLPTFGSATAIALADALSRKRPTRSKTR